MQTDFNHPSDNPAAFTVSSGHTKTTWKVGNTLNTVRCPLARLTLPL
jgi:hypothetical protein